MKLIATIVCAALASALSAQQLKTVPSGFADVEGGTTLTYPLGRAETKVQIIIDADQVTLTQGLLTGFAFRPNKQTGTQSSSGYTKNYMVTVYQTTTNAASFVADPVVNIAGAAGTVVFNGPVTVPNSAATATWPVPFNIQFTFNAPLLIDGTQGNLLILIETTDLVAPPTSYSVDAQLFRASTITGVVGPIDAAGCVANGNSLTLSNTATSATLGNTLMQSMTGSANVVAAMVLLGFVRQDVDLSGFGMPGCWARVGAFTSQLVVGNQATVQWGIPTSPALEGLPVFTQALGFPASGAIADFPVSNGEGVRISSNLTPVPHMDAAWYSVTSTNPGAWFKSGAGNYYAPVVQLQGVFP